MKLDPPCRGVASRQAQRPVRWANVSHVRVLELDQSRGTSGRRTTQGHADPLRGLVTASRLRLDHVVTGRGCVNPKSPASPGGAHHRGRSGPNATVLAKARLSKNEPRQANASSHKCRAPLLKALVEGSGKLHIPTTAEVNHTRDKRRSWRMPTALVQKQHHTEMFKSTHSKTRRCL